MPAMVERIESELDRLRGLAGEGCSMHRPFEPRDSHPRVGASLVRAGRLPELGALQARRLGWLHELVELDPTQRYRVALAVANHARQLRELGDHAEATQLFARAAEGFVALVRADPRDNVDSLVSVLDLGLETAQEAGDEASVQAFVEHGGSVLAELDAAGRSDLTAPRSATAALRAFVLRAWATTGRAALADEAYDGLVSGPTRPHTEDDLARLCQSLGDLLTFRSDYALAELWYVRP